jgi:hypothetical protein
MTDTVSRIPRAVVEQIIATALDGLDLTHDTAWIRPGSCPCRELPGRSCLLPPEEGGCQGHTAEVPTSDQHVVTAAIPPRHCLSLISPAPWMQSRPRCPSSA